jgi:hypothetical protein
VQPYSHKPKDGNNTNCGIWNPNEYIVMHHKVSLMAGVREIKSGVIRVVSGSIPIFIKNY